MYIIIYILGNVNSSANLKINNNLTMIYEKCIDTGNDLNI